MTTRKADTEKSDDVAGKYAVVWPDDTFRPGIADLVITTEGTAIPAAHLDAVKKAAADSNVTIKKVG